MRKANADVNLLDLAPEMVEFMNLLEGVLDRELTVTSGYRSINHPVERGKSSPGEHTEGLAVDVAAIGGNAVFEIVEAAIELGCKRIGISRKSNFIHLGLSPHRVTSIWTYS